MDFLKPPTDSLYKFVALSGLILILVSITWPPWLLNKLMLSQYEVEKDQKVLEAEINQTGLETLQFGLAEELFNVDTKELKVKTEELQQQSSSSKKQALNKEIEGLKAHWQERYKELEKRGQDQGRALAANQKMILEMNYKLKVFNWYTRAIRAVYVMAVLTFLIGLVMSVWGFRLWYLRLQIYQDALVKRQASIEHEGESTHV